ncbi:MAG: tetratricopeptide repeat protein [Candidatus Omnitrophica bacterium]|nr:tetratricopeptide repeat protein [Candidatus Omnitrophota bacterium]
MLRKMFSLSGFWLVRRTVMLLILGFLVLLIAPGVQAATHHIGDAIEDAVGYLNQGKAHIEGGRYDQAISVLNYALSINPVSAPIYLQRGIAYLKKNQYDQAIENFDKAIHYKSDDPQVYLRRGEAYFLKGDFDSAILDYTKVTQLVPDQGEAYIKLISTYLKKKDLLQARVAAKKAAEHNITLPDDIKAALKKKEA